MLPLLDKNYKHTTSFTFSKIDSINVKNNINKKKNASTCVAEFCTYTTIKENDKYSLNGLPISVNDSNICFNLVMLNTLNIPTAQQLKN